jgi:hypothetical protein
MWLEWPAETAGIAWRAVVAIVTLMYRQPSYSEPDESNYQYIVYCILNTIIVKRNFG